MRSRRRRSTFRRVWSYLAHYWTPRPDLSHLYFPLPPFYPLSLSAQKATHCTLDPYVGFRSEAVFLCSPELCRPPVRSVTSLLSPPPPPPAAHENAGLSRGVSSGLGY